jgi:hypothetical protein
VKIDVYSGSVLGNYVNYNPGTTTCSFPKNLELYFFYYPVEGSDGQVYQKISKAMYIAKNDDLELSKTDKNFIQVAVKYVDLTGEDTIA